MKRLFLHTTISVLAFAAIPLMSSGQSYQHAIGVKLGSPFGLSFKAFIDDNEAIEILGTGWPHGPRGTFLYQWHKEMNNPQFCWYVGTGAHLQLYTLTSVGIAERFRFSSEKGYGFGVEGVAGIEYKIRKTPIITDFNLKPNFEVTSFGEYAINYDPSLTIRFILK